MTNHNEYGGLKKVLLSHPENVFYSDEKIESEWKNLGFLQPPNLRSAIEEYESFKNVIQEFAEIDVLSIQTDKVSLDGVYCRDASIMTDWGAIICAMGKDNRVDEVEMHNAFYRSKGIPILGTIHAPGTLEGGDVAWINAKTLAVAHSYRTNLSGIEQLKQLLVPRGIEVITVDLPHYKGEQDVFHLMSIFSPITDSIAVVYSPLMPVSFRKELLSRGMDLVEVPDQEFESMGWNVLALDSGHCLMVDGNPVTRARIEQKGIKVMTYSGQNISVFGGGGPTCLTRPLLRESS